MNMNNLSSQSSAGCHLDSTDSTKEEERAGRSGRREIVLFVLSVLLLPACCRCTHDKGSSVCLYDREISPSSFFFVQQYRCGAVVTGVASGRKILTWPARVRYRFCTSASTNQQDGHIGSNIWKYFLNNLTENLLNRSKTLKRPCWRRRREAIDDLLARLSSGEGEERVNDELEDWREKHWRLEERVNDELEDWREKPYELRYFPPCLAATPRPLPRNFLHLRGNRTGHHGSGPGGADG